MTIKSITSIKFVSDGEVLTARVGEELTGVRVVAEKRNGKTVERPKHSNYGITITSISGARPWLIHNSGSPRWANPIMTNEVVAIEYEDGSRDVGDHSIGG